MHTGPPSSSVRDPRRLAMTASLIVSVLMLVGKLSAYFLTHSAALLSDAAESVVHGVATAFAAFSLWYAGQPADADHPYGHRRITYFSAGVEGTLVVAAAVAVLASGLHGLVQGVELRNLGTGLLISGVLALVNLALGIVLLRIGRRTNTLVLVANGKHVLSDVLTTEAAIVGVGLVVLTGQTWLDPLAAVLIGGLILISGLGLVRTSFSGLMDRVSPQVTQELVAVLQAEVEGRAIAGYHQLRCRRADNELWVDVHVLIPGELRMSEAHRRVTHVEEAIRQRFPRDAVYVTTHPEPADHEAAHPGGHSGPADPLRGG